MNQKLQVRTALASLNQTELFRVLDGYLELSSARLEKSNKEISIKCFECGVKVKNKTAIGFGRNEVEALTNAVRNLMEAFVDDDKTFGLVKAALSTQTAKETNVNLNEQSQQHKALTLTTKHNSQQAKDQRPQKKVDTSEHMSRQSDYYTSSSSKIKHPNSSVKPRLHQSYMSQSVDHQDAAVELRKAHQYIKELELKIKQASVENESLRANIGRLSVDDLAGSVKPEPRPSQPSNLDTLEFKIHAKVRSISVEQSNYSPISKSQPPQLPLTRPSSFLTESTHTNISTLEDSKKEVRRVPRLKLQQLPNYHGRSNKSLNQSLMDAYTKGKK